MKKFLMVFVFLGISLTMFACQTDDPDNGDDVVVTLESIADQLENEAFLSQPIDSDINLPSSFQDINLSWESQNSDVLTDDGALLSRPAYGEDDLSVDFLVTLTREEETYTRTVSFTVLASDINPEDVANETIDDAIVELNALELFDGDISGSIDLPDELNGVSITWSSNNQTVFSNTGTFTKPYYHLSNEVDLTATFTVDGVSREVVYELTTDQYSRDESAVMLFEAEMAKLDWVDTMVDSNIDLPLFAGRLTMAWTSSDSNFITNTGYVNPPLYSEGPQDITMNVRVRYMGYEAYHDLDVTLAPLPEASIFNTVSLPFTGLGEEWLVEDTTLEIHYKQEGGMPYVDVLAFLEMIDKGAFIIDEETGEATDERYPGAILLDRLTIEEDGNILRFDSNDYDLHFVFDFDQNTATVNEFSFFNSFRAPTQTDFGAGLEAVDYVYHAPEELVTFDLGHYRLEIFIEDDMYLIPFHLANLFFSGSMYDVYYNGDALYGFDTYQRSDAEVHELLHDSSLAGQNIPEHKLLETYNYLVFTLDHFYGLRSDYGIDNFYDFVSISDVTRQGVNHFSGLYEMIMDLDDLHTSFALSGFYNPGYSPMLSIADFGPRYNQFYDVFQGINSGDGFSLLGQYFDGDWNAYSAREPLHLEYYEDETIARIRFYSFNTDTPDLFKDALEEIAAKGTVTDVIVDLSMNTGGIVGTMWQTLGYLTDDLIASHNINQGDGSRSTYWYETEMEAYDFEWYVMTSQMTYSAANMFAQHVKEMGAATLIGQRSQGGAASITTNILPTGAMIIMSSNNVSANDDYESIELGVEVDYQLSNNRFNSETHIVALINQIREDKAEATE